VDADERIKAAKESLAHGEHPVLGILCGRCGSPVNVYGRDIDDNPIHDPDCLTCRMKTLAGRRGRPVVETPMPRRQHCNRCYDNPPLAGMSWCGTCAMKAQDKRIAAGEDPALVGLTIAAIKAAIDSAEVTR